MIDSPDAISLPPSAAEDGITRTAKRGKNFRNRLKIRVCVGYNHGMLKRFMPPVYLAAQDSSGSIGGNGISSASLSRPHAHYSDRMM